MIEVVSPKLDNNRVLLLALTLSALRAILRHHARPSHNSPGGTRSPL